MATRQLHTDTHGKAGYSRLELRPGRDTRSESTPSAKPHKIYCIPAEEGYDLPLLSVETLVRTLYHGIEIVIGVVAFLVSLPIMLVVAVIIKLDSPGPVLFFQKRCGRSTLRAGRDIMADDRYVILDPHFSPEKKYWVPKTFTFVKFRTMYVDARERFPQLYNYDYSQEEIQRIAFKVPDDPRVTKAGEWLRKSTLDELPNFWNVITGDMRLVGPRPELFEMLHNYRPDQMTKFTVPPGITGFPQINGRGRLSFQDTVAFDLEYVRRRSVLLDVKVIVLTVWKVITKDGAF